jgi:hypothetical protein
MYSMLPKIRRMTTYGWYQHHFYCLFAGEFPNLAVGSIGATKSTTTQRRHCRENYTQILSQSHGHSLSVEQFATLIVKYLANQLPV